MSAEWQKALIFSLILHLFLVAGVLVLSRPFRPSPPKVIKISLRPAFIPTTPKPSVDHSSTKPQKSLAKKKTISKHTSAARPRAPKHTPRTKPHKRLKRTGSKIRKSPSAPKPRLSPKEEEILAQRLAALKAKTEEKKLEERLAALSQKVERGGLSLSGQGVSQGLLARLAAHLKAFWEVPVVLKGRQDLWAEVELEIAPDGHIISWHFVHRSGEPLFDEAVRATLKKANPLPAPGKSLVLPAVFRIEEK